MSLFGTDSYSLDGVLLQQQLDLIYFNLIWIFEFNKNNKQQKLVKKFGI